MNASTPLSDQIEEVAREIRQRQRVYPKWVEEGRYKKETAEKKMADMEAAYRTLQFLAKYADPLRLLIKTLQQYNPYDGVLLPDAVIEEALANPAVREVMAAFPGAVISRVGPPETTATDLF